MTPVVSDSRSDAFARTPDSNWQRAHAELERLAHSRARLDSEEDYWLLCASRARVHAELGYGSFSEYIERLFGYEPRWTKEKLACSCRDTSACSRESVLRWPRSSA
ncbi:MAG: hypothetical protein JW940_16660 [Polyangiaceae bacterium]|nr:hypothetical protein [Polyangiaceae bacterium]